MSAVRDDGEDVKVIVPDDLCHKPRRDHDEGAQGVEASVGPNMMGTRGSPRGGIGRRRHDGGMPRTATTPSRIPERKGVSARWRARSDDGEGEIGVFTGRQ